MNAKNNEFSPLIHIGYPKAASTSIQAILAELKDSFETSYSDGKITFREVVDELSLWFVEKSDYEFDAQECQKFFQSWLNPNKNLQAILFNERLAGHYYSGGYDTKKIASRIHSVWPNAKILIVVREQYSSVLSSYKHYIKKGGQKKFKDFVYPKRSPGLRIPFFQLDYYRYNDLINTYDSLFGQVNVLVLPSELLRSSPNIFFSMIYSHVGLIEDRLDYKAKYKNVGLNDFEVVLTRSLNYFFRKKYLVDGPDHFSLRHDIFERIFRKFINVLCSSALLRRLLKAKVEIDFAGLKKSHFSDSNYLLQKRIGLSLKEFGYLDEKD